MRMYHGEKAQQKGCYGLCKRWIILKLNVSAREKCEGGRNLRKNTSKKKKSILLTDKNFLSSAVGQVTDVTTGTIFIGRFLFDPMTYSWFMLLLSSYCVLVVNLHSAEKRKENAKFVLFEEHPKKSI